MTSITEDICELLDSYNGRDKVVRLACYTFKLYGCVRKDKSWQTAGSRLSNARLMLRLFDDIPMIRHTYYYGLGRHETSRVAAVLGVLANIVDQAFLPVEKACWLHDVGILKLTPRTADMLETASTALWAASLAISLMQTCRSIRQLWWSRDCLQSSSEAGGAARRNLDIRLAIQAVTATKLCLDITHAVSCLPDGCLWGEKIDGTKVAAIATTSSLIGIAIYFARKRLLNMFTMSNKSKITVKPNKIMDNQNHITDDPYKITDKPKKITDKPKKITDKQNNIADEPNEMTDEPKTITDKPNNITDEPNEITDEPKAITDKPNNITDEPKKITDKPNNFTDEPNEITDEPKTITDKPNNITDEPNTKIQTELFAIRAKRNKINDKPKRPMSAYMLWRNSARESIKAEHPGLKVTEIAKKGGEIWKNMKDKSEWEEKAAKAKEQYDKDLESYCANDTNGGDDYFHRFSPVYKNRPIARARAIFSNFARLHTSSRTFNPLKTCSFLTMFSSK